METLAFIHTAISFEDPNPDPEVKVFDNLDMAVPSSTLMGLAGAAVAVTVLSGTPGKANAAPAILGRGSTGAEVQAVQAALGIQADGNYDEKTETAVTDFQIRQGLKAIDGIVGKETATALGLDEAYRPVGYVYTNSGIGLNIRSGPGLGYYIIGGAPDGAFLYQDYETVVYNHGYAWTPLYTGGWVASDYTYEPYYPVSYYGGETYNGGYYPVSYRGGCYRGCYRPTAYYYYGKCGSTYIY